MRRDVPTLIYGDVASGDTYGYTMDLHATNLASSQANRWPYSISRPAWAGTNTPATPSSSSAIRSPRPSSPTSRSDLNSSRVLGFLNAGLSVSMLRLTGEVGYQGGKDQNLSTDFEDFDTTQGKVLRRPRPASGLLAPG